MASLDRKTVNVLSRDIIQAGCEDAALRALDRLVEDVRLHEPETLTFQVHTAATGDPRLPPVDQRHVTILAVYPDIEGFSATPTALYSPNSGLSIGSFLHPPVASRSRNSSVCRRKPDSAGTRPRRAASQRRLPPTVTPP